MDADPEFVFATCQVGAEPALKNEVARRWPDWRFAFSRPGFLTFKLPGGFRPDDDFALGAVFARAYGISLGSVRGQSPRELAQQVWQTAGQRSFDRVHVWSRDLATPGYRGFEPGIHDDAAAAREALLQCAPDATFGPGCAEVWASPAGRGDSVLDCILLAPDEWWLGTHRASSRATCWPGGFWPGTGPEEVVSRAYFKMAEALEWSALPIKPGQRCVEIGCAPGGASQALLDHGLRVTGIDPAAVDSRVLERSDFRHIRRRGADLGRREYREFQWLVADMNVVPAYTLATVGDIVTHRLVRIRGMILFLKLLDWKLADAIPQYVERIKSFGYSKVRLRQLGHNRQEICLTAYKPARRRRHHHRTKTRSGARR